MTITNSIIRNAIACNAVKGTDKIAPHAIKFLHSKQDKADLASALGNKTFAEAYAENENGGWIKGLDSLDTMVRDAAYDALALYDGGSLSPKSMVKIGEYNQTLELAHSNIIKSINWARQQAEKFEKMKRTIEEYGRDAESYLVKNPGPQAEKMLKEIVKASSNILKMI